MPKSQKPRKDYNPNKGGGNSKSVQRQQQSKPDQATSLWRVAALTTIKTLIPALIALAVVFVCLYLGISLVDYASVFAAIKTMAGE